MPIREVIIPMETIEHGGRSYAISVESIKESNKTKEQAEEFNSQLDKLRKWVKAELEDNEISGTFVIRAFNKLNEGVGKEKILPRNYLSEEVFELTTLGKKIIIFLGEFDTLLDFKEQLIDIINNKLHEFTKPKEERKFTMPNNTSEPAREKRQETKEDSQEDVASIDDVRLLFRRK